MKVFNILYVFYTCGIHVFYLVLFNSDKSDFKILSIDTCNYWHSLDSWNLDHCIVKVTQLSASRFYRSCGFKSQLYWFSAALNFLFTYLLIMRHSFPSTSVLSKSLYVHQHCQYFKVVVEVDWMYKGLSTGCDTWNLFNKMSITNL